MLITMSEFDANQDISRDSSSDSEKSTDSQIGLCDNCDDEIFYAKHAYYVLTKEDEKLCWCQFCFDDLWKEMRDEKWKCDDFEICEEEHVYCSEDSEDSEEEDKEDIDKPDKSLLH